MVIDGKTGLIMNRETISTRSAKPASAWVGFDRANAEVDMLAFHYRMPIDEIKDPEARYQFVRGYALARGQRAQVRDHILDQLEAAMRSDNEHEGRKLDALEYLEALKAGRRHGR